MQRLETKFFVDTRLGPKTLAKTGLATEGLPSTPLLGANLLLCFFDGCSDVYTMRHRDLNT